MSRCTFGESFAIFCNYNGSFREKDIAFTTKGWNTFVFNIIVQKCVCSIDKIDNKINLLGEFNM